MMDVPMLTDKVTQLLTQLQSRVDPDTYQDILTICDLATTCGYQTRQNEFLEENRHLFQGHLEFSDN